MLDKLFFYSFPVDFSTANIFNSAQYNSNMNNMNNNFMTQPIPSNTAFNAFGSSPASSSKFYHM